MQRTIHSCGNVLTAAARLLTRLAASWILEPIAILLSIAESRLVTPTIGRRLRIT